MCLFETLADITSLEKCTASVATDATVADIVPMLHGRFFVGLDSGALELIQLTKDEPLLLETLFYRCEHDAAITSLAHSPDGRCVASGSCDLSIKLWDMSCMECSRTYVTAHAGPIWKVKFSTDPNVFLSCSKDGKVRSWDIRLSRPATNLGKYPCVPTSLDWQPQSPSSYAVGLESGEVVLRDLRNPSDDVLHTAPHKRSLHSLLFCAASPNWLASCADDTRVCVMDVSKTEDCLIYKGDEHTEFVRGLSWKPGSKQLLSSGWDGRVLEHSVAASPMETGRGEI